MSLLKLDWSSSSGATSYDVYFGTDSTPDAGEYKGNVTSSEWQLDQCLVPGVTYYWKIVPINDCGSTGGYTWSFTLGG
jgi:hypothetical protein